MLKGRVDSAVELAKSDRMIDTASASAFRRPALAVPLGVSLIPETTMLYLLLAED